MEASFGPSEEASWGPAPERAQRRARAQRKAKVAEDSGGRLAFPECPGTFPLETYSVSFYRDHLKVALPTGTF